MTYDAFCIVAGSREMRTKDHYGAKCLFLFNEFDHEKRTHEQAQRIETKSVRGRYLSCHWIGYSSYWTFFADFDDGAVFNVFARCWNICLYIVGKSKLKQVGRKEMLISSPRTCVSKNNDDEQVEIIETEIPFVGQDNWIAVSNRFRIDGSQCFDNRHQFSLDKWKANQ